VNESLSRRIHSVNSNRRNVLEVGEDIVLPLFKGGDQRRVVDL